MAGRWNYPNFLNRKRERPAIDFSQVKEYHINNGKKSRIPCVCIECSNIWITTLDSIFVALTGCPKWNKKEKWNYQRFEKEKWKRPDLDFSQVTSFDIKNSSSMINTICRECGNLWRVRLNLIFTRYNGCPSCRHEKSWSRERLAIESVKRPDIDFSLVEGRDGIVSTRRPIVCRCVKCQTVWCARLKDVFEANEGCPSCVSTQNGNIS